jgi:hypothetical protein
MSPPRLRVCRNSGETQEIKTDGWFMDCYFPECFCLVLAVVAQKGVKDLGFEVLEFTPT